MFESILKTQWERFQDHIDIDTALATKLLADYTNEPIVKLELLSDGCANTNYKVTFQEPIPAVILRIYLRDKTAMAREAAIHQFVANKIPVSRHLYLNDSQQLIPYSYAITEWIDGESMRAVILSKDEKEMGACTYEAGKFLSLLREIRLPLGGFFQENLEVRPFAADEEYLTFITAILNDEIIKKDLPSDLITALHKLINHYANLLPNVNDANLTHGDYDPSNILVKKVHGQYKIAAILDWEFAFAGTYLLDMGLMLRYSHKLPACYEQNFVEAIENYSEALPTHWKKQAKLMDLLCLLQLVHSNPADARPKMNKDLVELITYTVKHFDKF